MVITCESGVFFLFGVHPCYSIFICVARLSWCIAFSLSHSVFVLTAISRRTWFRRCLSKQRMTEVMVTTGAITFKLVKAPVKSSPPTKPTHSFFTGRMPLLSPNKQCQSTDGKISHSMDLLKEAHLGSSNCLWPLTDPVYLGGRIAMPLISHLMPIPQTSTLAHGKI